MLDQNPMKPLAERFAEFFCRIGYESLPAAVVDQTKMSLLDLIGVAIGGMDMAFPKMASDYLRSLGGREEATILGSGTGRKYPAVHAALANGICAHALDMDDGYRFGAVHSGAAVIPAALAGAETMHSDGKELIVGIVMGFELVNRLSRAMNPSHLKRGFHTTGTVGALGAATAAGCIYGLTAGEMTSALGLAGLQGAGLLEILNDGAMVKPVHPGKAGYAGIFFGRTG